MKTKLIILSSLCLITIGSIKGFGPGGDLGMIKTRYMGNEAAKLFVDGFLDRNRDSIRKAIALGADINGNYDAGWTALAIAARNGWVNKVQFLLDLGANPNVITPDTVIIGGGVGTVYSGSTPLMVAILGPVWLNVRDLRPRAGRSIAEIREAKKQRKIELIRMLINSGTDLDIQDSQGQTALMLAVLKRDEDAVQTLINAGASLGITNNDGQTALDIAVENMEGDYSPILKLIYDEYARRHYIQQEVKDLLAGSSDLEKIVSEYAFKEPIARN